MRRSFDSFLLSLADKVTIETYHFVFLIVKIILSESQLSTLSAQAADRIQYFVQLSFNSTLQLLKGILSDLQKLLKYFNGTAIIAFFKISFASSASVFCNNLALYLKDLKSSVFTISKLKLVVSSFE